MSRGAAVLAASLLLTAGLLLGPLPALAFDLRSAEQQLFTLVNQEREANGLSPVQPETVLFRLGRTALYEGCGFPVYGRSHDMIARQYFSHTIAGCGAENAFGLMHAYAIPYLAAAENIGWNNYADPESVARINRAFMSSPTHRANVLNPAFTHLGVGVWAARGAWNFPGSGNCPCQGVKMYTQLFIQLAPALPDGPPADDVIAPAVLSTEAGSSTAGGVLSLAPRRGRFESLIDGALRAALGP
jgi:hypothetical protein